MFNFDAPDGVHSYWQVLQKENELFPTRQLDGFPQCVDVLLPHFLNQGNRIPALTVYFKQNNISIHSPKDTKKIFEDITTIHCPTNHLDLNPVDNVWNIIGRNIYNNGQIKNGQMIQCNSKIKFCHL